VVNDDPSRHSDGHTDVYHIVVEERP
jgi:hypothetical protein